MNIPSECARASVVTPFLKVARGSRARATGTLAVGSV